MSPRSEFGAVADRLCHIRPDRDEAQVSVPLDRAGFLDASAEFATAVSELGAGALVDPAIVFQAGVLILLGEPGVGKSTTFKALVDENDANVVWVDAADLTDGTFDDRFTRHVRELPPSGTDAADCGPALTVVLDQIAVCPQEKEGQP